MKERYLHSVRILMDCPPKERERLLSRLNHAVTAYLEDVPEANEMDLFVNFGTPEDCAVKLSAECAPKVVLAERQKIKHHRILVAFLSVLLAIVIGVAALLWSNGGLVIIKTDRWAPDSLKELPTNHIIYDYND